MSNKPILVYVDDEPQNLVVFEAAMPAEWEVLVFDNPLKALEQMTKIDPWVVASDQRMPGMTGVSFLEIIKRTNPRAKRALITGYSEEDLIIDSVRKAGVHDYVRKPWDVDDLCHRMQSLVDTYRLEMELHEKNQQIERQLQEVVALTKDLEKAKSAEESLRKELEAWAPPFIVSALQDPKTQFPMTKDLAMITFDIIGSSKLHGLTVADRPVRSIIIKEFSELVIKHGGLRESHSGDSAYAHFGLVPGFGKPEESAFAVATEFRTFLRTFSVKNNIQIECGIALHSEKDVPLLLHTAEILTTTGVVVQKSFDSSSLGVDLLHRIEKMVHTLPGSNIILTEDFLRALNTKIIGLIEIGACKLKGQPNACLLHLKTGDQVTEQDVINFKRNLDTWTDDVAPTEPKRALAS